MQKPTRTIQKKLDFLKNHTTDFADIVLELDEENDKALYRKAQALKLLRDFSGARETFEKLKSVQAKKGQNVPKDVINEKKKTSLTHLLCLSNPENSKNNPEY